MNRPRTATALTHYNAVGQADWTQDAAGHRTTFFYDPCTGRCAAVSNAVGVELGDRRKVARKSLRTRWAAIINRSGCVGDRSDRLDDARACRSGGIALCGGWFPPSVPRSS